MNPMTLTNTQRGWVTLAYDDPSTGERVVREFSASNDGEVGWVHEWHGGEQTKVCEQLAPWGTALYADVYTLPVVIGREYRAMRAAERRPHAF